jgi:hypothetical protein
LALLLGLSPFAASCWVVPKPVLLEQPFRAGLSHQHGGQAGTDTVWLRFKAGAPPAWLSAYGGALRTAYEQFALKQVGGEGARTADRASPALRAEGAPDLSSLFLHVDDSE